MRIAVIFLAFLALGTAAFATSAGSTCNGSATWTHCSIGNNGTGVDVSAGQTQPGNNSGRSGDRNPGRQTRPPAPPAAPCDTTVSLCRGNYTVVGVPDVTLADLVSFVPARPTLTGEPAGLGIVGMPTNIVASASEQLIAGRLLDYDVVVKFVPAGFRFDYGDGKTRASATGGSSWARLGQAAFTPTSTSHVYAVRGTYSVRVTALYSASVDFGSGTWRPVDGYVESTAGGYDVRVVEVHTALVDKTCLENPSGPGC